MGVVGCGGVGGCDVGVGVGDWVIGYSCICCLEDVELRKIVMG